MIERVTKGKYSIESKIGYQLGIEKYKNIETIKNFVKNCDKFNEQFEILNYINSGSCGIVYEGKIRHSKNKKVALKFILNKIIENKNEKERNDRNAKDKLDKKIHREITLQSLLKHKNITNLYGVYATPHDSFCMVMELAKFGDLEYLFNKIRKTTKRINLSETFLAYITKQILNALLYCRNTRIVHMDIKQQNILINENLQIKLADLSISFSYFKIPDNTNFTLPLAGTSVFISPEVLFRKEINSENAHKVDLYSLGVLLYSLAYCKYPYELSYNDKKEFNVIKEKIANNNLEIPINKGYSKLFEDFVSKLLNKDINNRISIDEAINHSWIKAARLIFLEKEKFGDVEKFLLNMVTNNVKPFTDYLHNNSL